MTNKNYVYEYVYNFEIAMTYKFRN